MKIKIGWKWPVWRRKKLLKTTTPEPVIDRLVKKGFIKPANAGASQLIYEVLKPFAEYPKNYPALKKDLLKLNFCNQCQKVVSSYSLDKNGICPICISNS